MGEGAGGGAEVKPGGVLSEGFEGSLRVGVVVVGAAAAVGVGDVLMMWVMVPGWVLKGVSMEVGVEETVAGGLWMAEGRLQELLPTKGPGKDPTPQRMEGSKLEQEQDRSPA